MSDPDCVRIDVGGLTFVARLERTLAPRTCTIFEGMLPHRNTLLQARWCGEAAWVPLGNGVRGVEPENATSFPAPGQLLFHPGGASETEILVPYGAAHFTSKVGPLAGNHFLSIIDGAEQLVELGSLVLWQGAQRILFERA